MAASGKHPSSEKLTSFLAEYTDPPERLLHNIDKVLEELKSDDDASFSIEAMKMVVWRKMFIRKKKGLDFNCVVLDRDKQITLGVEKKESGESIDELEALLIKLNKEKESLPEGSRFQIIYRTTTRRPNKENPDQFEVGCHWSTADVQINKGKIHIYLLDAANFIPSVASSIALIHSKCPDCVLTYSGGEIQDDTENCATFSLDHAFRLSKILGLHAQLAQDINILKTELKESKMENILDERFREVVMNKLKDKPGLLKDYKIDLDLLKKALNQVIFFPVDAFNLSFAPLIRHKQNFVKIKQLALRPYKDAKGNDTLSLLDYVSFQKPKDQKYLTTYASFFSGVHPSMQSIVLKRLKIKHKLKTLIEAYKDALKANKDEDERLYHRYKDDDDHRYKI